MKKIFTSLFTLLLALPVVAQSFGFVREGKAIENGATLHFGYEALIPGVVYEWATHVNFKCDKAATYKFELKSENQRFTMCPGNNCYGPGTISLSLPVSTNYDLQLHPTAGALFGAGNADEKMSGTITVYDAANPSEKVTLNIVYYNKAAADVAIFGGVDGVANNAPALTFDGAHTLSYNFAAATPVSIYSILGTKVFDRALSGQGHLDLSGISSGVYIYRAGRTTGKFLLK